MIVSSYLLKSKESISLSTRVGIPIAGRNNKACSSFLNSFSSRDAALPLLSLCLFAYLTLSRGTDTDSLTMLSLTSEKTGREKPVTVRLRSYLTIEESSLLNTCKSNEV